MERTMIALIEAEYRRYKALGEGAFNQLADDQLAIPLGNGNSVVTLVWHIAGNLASRFTDFLTTDGEKPWRDRDSELQARRASLVEVQERWKEGWTILLTTLTELSDRDLSRVITIRGVELRVDEALLRSLAHASYHVGQIVYVSKSLKANAWSYLSIPPGHSAAYNQNPTMERATQHAEAVRPK